MGLGDWIDGAIAPFSPARALRRTTQRTVLVNMKRQYDAASADRRNKGWRRPSSSADSEIGPSISRLRDGARDLCRNNKYAAAAKKQLVANLVGDGIEARAIHPDPGIQKAAQDEWESFARSRVDGRHDVYGVQKLAVSAMVEGGESLIIWSPDAKGPDGRCVVVEGDFLDQFKNVDSLDNGGRIVQGVEYAANGDRAAYWLYDKHPGDNGLMHVKSSRIEGDRIDHVFEAQRPGQTRGVTWFAPVMMALRNVGIYEEALIARKNAESCLALILTPPDSGAPGTALGPTSADSTSGAQDETLRPGMIWRTQAGETASTVTPTASGDGIEFIRQQMAAVSANLAPYHLITGDASQANYSSMRGLSIGFWANLDDSQNNTLYPFLCQPAFDRRMKRLALLTGNKKFLEVRASWAPPPRRFIDPSKDIAAEILEIRSGLKTMPQALSERGKNWVEQYAEIASSNNELDKNGLALEVDPRRLTDSGMLQAAVGYLAPRSATPSIRAISFGASVEAARESGDGAAINMKFAEVAQALRANDPDGPAMADQLVKALAQRPN